MGDVGCALLHSGFSELLNIESLNLQNCGIHSKGCAYIATAVIKFRHKSKLQHLDMRQNRIAIGDEFQVQRKKERKGISSTSQVEARGGVSSASPNPGGNGSGAEQEVDVDLPSRAMNGDTSKELEYNNYFDEALQSLQYNGPILLAEAVAVCMNLVHLDISQNLLPEQNMKLFVTALSVRKKRCEELVLRMAEEEEILNDKSSLLLPTFTSTSNAILDNKAESTFTTATTSAPARSSTTSRQGFLNERLQLTEYSLTNDGILTQNLAEMEVLENSYKQKKSFADRNMFDLELGLSSNDLENERGMGMKRITSFVESVGSAVVGGSGLTSRTRKGSSTSGGQSKIVNAQLSSSSTSKAATTTTAVENVDERSFLLAAPSRTSRAGGVTSSFVGTATVNEEDDEEFCEEVDAGPATSFESPSFAGGGHTADTLNRDHADKDEKENSDPTYRTNGTTTTGGAPSATPWWRNFALPCCCCLPGELHDPEHENYLKRSAAAMAKNSQVYINIVPGNFMSSEILNACSHLLGCLVIPLLYTRLFSIIREFENFMENKMPSSVFQNYNGAAHNNFPPPPPWQQDYYNDFLDPASPAAQSAHNFSLMQNLGTFALGTFLFTAFIMFLNSCVYHALFYVVRSNQAMQVLDHSGIYCLIAGTYFPIIVIGCDNTYNAVVPGMWYTSRYFDSSSSSSATNGNNNSFTGTNSTPSPTAQYGPLVLLLVYLILTFLGLTISIQCHAKKWYPNFVVVMYVVMGFLGAPYMLTTCFVGPAEECGWNNNPAQMYNGNLSSFNLVPSDENVKSHYWWAKALIALGGAFYLFGVYFFLQRQYPFYHVIWHLFVIFAFLAHYGAIEAVVEASIEKQKARRWIQIVLAAGRKDWHDGAVIAGGD
ncbi:unnamed protein product [Amoebophrya sp. A120]|nr:unnamed protein product [Amoebophrya sp. A120]|eukprot:GSA120T00020719001.1